MRWLNHLKTKFRLIIRKLSISEIIVFSFMIVIAIGTLLLWLPVAARNGKSNGLLTAVFTATSATCVTGLSLGDTYSQWSIFGQVIILILIEVGGLGFMSIASFFFFALRKRFDMKSMLIMAQSIGAENLQDVVRIQKKIIKGGLLVETIGALILAVRFSSWYSIPKSIWLGIFHSISAFCNAGFDILGFITPGSSLIEYQTDKIIILTLSLLIIIGGIGFIVWDDFTRVRNPRKWTAYTKIVLITTSILLIAGTVFYFILEFENKKTMGNLATSDKLLNAFFQAVTTRTAGFASIDQAGLTETGKILTILLMFIGGASGSTAGGLKVATFTVIILFLISRMRGRDTISVFNRKISNTHIMDALCLFGMMTILSFAGTIIICGTTDFRFIDSLYETVSALATVGLSTGVLSGMNLIAKLLIIVYMFFGRIGILTISMGFLQKSNKVEHYKYPEMNLPIG